MQLQSANQETVRRQRETEEQYARRQYSLGTSAYSLADREGITNFLTHLEAQGLSRARLAKYLGQFLKLRPLLGNRELVSLKGNELDSIVRDITANRKWGDWTKHDYLIALKKFFRFNDGNDDRAGRIKAKTPAMTTINEAEVITPDDLARLERATRNIRDKAVLRFLFETGARAGEMLGLRVGDVKRQPPFLEFKLTGTKNHLGARPVTVINPEAVALFDEYLQHHPQPNNPNAPLWVTLSGQPLEPKNLSKLLKVVAKRAGLDKRINPHWFRHSAYTKDCKDGMPVSLRETKYGHKKGSIMSRIYDHTDIDALKEWQRTRYPVAEERKTEIAAEAIMRALLTDEAALKAITQALARQGSLTSLTELAPFPQLREGFELDGKMVEASEGKSTISRLTKPAKGGGKA